VATATSIREYVCVLKRGEIVPLPLEESWKEHIERLSVSGRIAQVSEAQYSYWLEVLPPRWMEGSHFCFVEGADAFTLFWHDRDGYFGRQLTWDETVTFCRLARISLPD
jgi:hypothetical protein